MKKGLLITSAFALLFGVGVAVGAQQGQVRKAEAWDSSHYSHIYIVGGFAASQGTFLEMTKATENGDYEKTVEMEAGDWFKFTNAANWDGIVIARNWDGITKQSNTCWTDLTTDAGEEDNHNFVINDAGTYRVYMEKDALEGSWTEAEYGIHIEKIVEPTPDPDPVVYKATVNGHEYTLASQDKGDYDEQYKVAINAADVVKGASVSFTADSVALAATGDSANNNNIYVPGNKILETSETSVDLWLKKKNSDWTYWLGGRNASYYLVNGDNVVALAKNGDKNEYFVTGLDLAKDSTVRLYGSVVAYDGKVKDGSTGASVKEGVITIDETGNYDIYYEPSENNYVYFQQNHTFTVEYGLDQSATLAPVDKGDYDAQYKATITVSAGDQLSFKRDGIALVVAENGTNHHNVFVPQHKIINGGEVDVYLQYKNSAWQYFVSGREATYYLYSNSSFVALMPNPKNSNEVYATNVALATNASVQIYETSVTNPTLNDSSDKTAVEVSEEVIRCIKGGTYNVYYNFEEMSLYVGPLSDADRAANAYADLFLETLSTGEGHVCQENGNSNLEALDTAWKSLKTSFNSIAEDAEVKSDAQGILRNANSSADTQVGRFAKLYDYIVKKYGDTAFEDFADRFDEPVAPGTKLAEAQNNSGSSYVAVIIIAATVSAIAVGTFLLLKKKHN